MVKFERMQESAVLSGGARECQRSNGSVRAWVDNGTNVMFALVSDNDVVQFAFPSLFASVYVDIPEG